MQETGDLPLYTNIDIPWGGEPPFPPADNPTGVYRRTVEIPPDWAGRPVTLHVGAAESVLLVEVDGVPVGMSKDSHLAAEFDVTDLLTPGAHELVLTVVKWSDATFVEDQDQWWHGGLPRSVFLFHPGRLRDLHVDTTHQGGLVVRAVADSGRIAVRLAGRDLPADGLELRTSVDAAPWSPELPRLHDLEVDLLEGDEVVDSHRLRIGFRTVEVRGLNLLINGERMVVRGVNRHDVDTVTGRVLSREAMTEEVLLLKRFGFNAVRTSHYPNDPYFLDLCDEHGLLVVDEADIEAHAQWGTLCDDPRYAAAWVDRVARMVQRDRNHACVGMWSLGNESGYGENHRLAAAWVRENEPTRPLHYEGSMHRGWSHDCGGQRRDLPDVPAARPGARPRPLR